MFSVLLNPENNECWSLSVLLEILWGLGRLFPFIWRGSLTQNLHISLGADGSLPGYLKMFHPFNKLTLATQLHKENSDIIARSSQVCSSQEFSDNYSLVLSMESGATTEELLLPSLSGHLHPFTPELTMGDNWPLVHKRDPGICVQNKLENRHWAVWQSFGTCTFVWWKLEHKHRPPHTPALHSVYQIAWIMSRLCPNNAVFQSCHVICDEYPSDRNTNDLLKLSPDGRGEN